MRVPGWLVLWAATQETIDAQVNDGFWTVAKDGMDGVRWNADKIAWFDRKLLGSFWPNLERTCSLDHVEDLLGIIVDM
jgi:hypothetical protein